MPNESKWDKYKSKEEKWSKYKATPVDGGKTATPEEPSQAFYDIGKQPMELAKQGAKAFSSGDIPLGIAKGGRAGLSAGMELTGIPTAIRGLKESGTVGNFIGSGLEGVMSTPLNIFNFLSGGIESGLRSAGVPESILNMGMSPEASKEGGALATEAGILGLTPYAKQGAIATSKAMSRGAEKVASTFEKKAITPPFDKKKGLEVIDRQVNTALEKNYAPSRKGISKLEADLDRANKTSKEISSRSAKSGKTIDFNETYKFLDEKLSRAERSSADYPEIETAIKDVKQRLERVRQKYPDGKVPIDIANEMKSSFQGLAVGNFDQALPPSKIQIDMYKKTGGKLLEQIISEEPQLRGIGLRQRDLIELKPILERKVDVTEKVPFVNWQGVRKLGLAGSAGVLSGSPLVGALTFGVEEALTNPKSLHFLAQRARGIAEKSAYPDVTGTPLYGGRYNSTIPYEMRQKLIRELGLPENISNKELIRIAKERNVFSNAPIDEAPVTRGGNMGVRGKNTQEQMRRNKK